jgi:Cu/Ag efflux protein CusF
MKVLATFLAVALIAMSFAWVPETMAQQTQPSQPSAPAAQPPAGAGAAKEVSGAVKSVDVSKKSVTLQDGTTLMVADEAKLKDLKPGTMIKASYEDKGGQKTATSIEVVK